MKKRTIIIIIVGALVLAASAYGIVSAQQRDQSRDSEFQTYQVSRGELSAVVDETGEVHADQSAILYWESTGVVGQVEVELGDRVSADQVLASIREDSLPQSYFLSQQELITANRALEDLYENAAAVSAQAQSELAQARDALDDAEYRWLINQPGNRYSPEGLAAAKARVVIAEEAMDNKQKRFDNTSGRVPRAQAQLLLTAAINEYQQAVWSLNWLLEGADDIEMGILDANVAVAQTRLENAEREYEKVKDGPDPDDIRLAEARIAAAQAAVDAAVITAPFDGVITSVEIIEGDLVAPNTVAFRIDNLDRLLVDVGVSEVDINKIAPDQEVILVFDAIQGKEYNGKVVNVSPVGVQQQGLVSFEVTAEVLDPDQDVKPGLTAAVQIVFRQVEDALLIPNRAVRWVQGEQVVYVAQDENRITETNLEKIPVTLGASSDQFSELVGGDVSLGDLIILNPPSISIFEEAEAGQGPPAAFR